MKKNHQVIGSAITVGLVIAVGAGAFIGGAKSAVTIPEARAAEIEPSVEDVQRICGLTTVECEGEEAVPVPIDNPGSFVGYDITAYATNPTHEDTVKAIYNAMPEIADKFAADKYIKARRPKSPVTGGMVWRASAKYNVDPRMVLALMQNDSAFGTAGLGARTRNPGNIANRDDGHTFTYGSWELGVEGVARWLKKHETN